MAFIPKRSQTVTPQKRAEVRVQADNKTTMEDKTMDTAQKLDTVEAIVNDEPKKVKKIKKDKGLIERTESSKTIITEDNKQLIFG